MTDKISQAHEHKRYNEAAARAAEAALADRQARYQRANSQEGRPRGIGAPTDNARKHSSGIGYQREKAAIAAPIEMDSNARYP